MRVAPREEVGTAPEQLREEDREAQGVRRREDQTSIGSQNAANPAKEVVRVLKVLDELPRDDRMKRLLAYHLIDSGSVSAEKANVSVGFLQRTVQVETHGLEATKPWVGELCVSDIQNAGT